MRRHSDQLINGVGVFSGMKPLKDHIAVTVRSPTKIIVHEVSLNKYRAGFFDARNGPVADVISIEGVPIVGPIDQVLYQVFERFETCVEHFDWRHRDGSSAVCPSSRLTLLGYPDSPTGNSDKGFR